MLENLFGKSPYPLCSFCKLHDETPIHLFSSCNQIIDYNQDIYHWGMK